MKAYITLFGEPEEINQRVQIDFDHEGAYEFFTPVEYVVNFCEILTPLEIKATDIDGDVLLGIAEALGCSPIQVSIICEVECINLYKEPKVILEEIGV